MGNLSYSQPNMLPPAEQPIEGFRWRLGQVEKVLLFGRDPLGSVSFDSRKPKSKLPWLAHTSSGQERHARFALESEAIAFVEAAMPGYLAFREFRRLNPPTLPHVSPPPYPE